MALVTVGPGLVMPGSQPYSPPAASASASPSVGSMSSDSYGAASTPAAPATGVVQAKSFLSNLWDELFAPLLGGIWSAISSIFQGL